MRLRQAVTAAFAVMAFVGLTGCESIRETFGIGSQVNNPWTNGEDLSGTTVSVLGVFAGTEEDRFNESMDYFETETGITVAYEAVENLATSLEDKLASSDPPDVIAFPQPGFMKEYVESGEIHDVSNMIDAATLEATYDESWRSVATHNGTVGGIWYRAGVKSLVWYPHPEFTDAGYEVPTTWSELIALSNQMVDDGETPWSVGIESGTASGWVATDWMEDIMLRTVPPESYDKWVAGELQFDSQEVRRAADIMAEIWFNADYVLDGTTGIVETSFGDAIKPLEANPPIAWLHRQATFITSFFATGTDLGDDMRFFLLPSIDAEEGDPVLVAGDMMSPTNGDPATAALIRYLASGESIRPWIEAGGAVSPHNDAELDWYPDEWTRKSAEILRNADTLRFDASDLMPPEVGTAAFWSEMVNWVNGESLDSVLADIDAAWP